MINKKKEIIYLWIFTYLFHFSYISCSTIPASTGISTSTGLSTATDYTTTTVPATTSYSDYEDVTETSNNVIWLIVGVVCAVVLVVGIVLAAAIAYAIHKSKRIHPHSDTESFYTESESPSEAHSRPTTASHIMLEPEEEAMSKPVTMTPFELRKLYIETFPYRNWRRGFDGSLRPKMTLRFVDPSIYSRSKGEEQQFRDKIYNYEMSDSLTLRSSALSRMMHHAKMPTMSEMEPLPESHQPSAGHEVQSGQGQQEQHEQYCGSNNVEFERVCMRSEDVELM